VSTLQNIKDKLSKMTREQPEVNQGSAEQMQDNKRGNKSSRRITQIIVEARSLEVTIPESR